jgi:hypothetical protein
MRDEFDKFQYRFSAVCFIVFFVLMIDAIKDERAIASAICSAVATLHLLVALKHSKRFDLSGGNNGG